MTLCELDTPSASVRIAGDTIERCAAACLPAEVVLFLQAISVTEELLQDEVPDDEQLPSSAAAAAPKQPARPGPNIVLTQAPTIQLSSVLPATVRPVSAIKTSADRVPCI